MVKVQQRDYAASLPPSGPGRRSADIVRGQGTHGVIARIRRSLDVPKRISQGDRKNSHKLINLKDVELQEGPTSTRMAKGYDQNLARGMRRVSTFVRDERKEAKESSQGTLGVWRGVFFPCLQNIFGILLFIRLSWITGVAGIGISFLTVLTSMISVFLTALSMSAIATNGKVAAGGSYFMISRALGPALGGAVGILFYLGTTVAAAMYVLGAVEAVQANIWVFSPGRFIHECTSPKSGGMCDSCGLLNQTIDCIASGLQGTPACMPVEASSQLCQGVPITDEIAAFASGEGGYFYVSPECCLFSINEARLYGTLLAIFTTCIVLAGMKVVTLIDMVFLFVVLISILSIYLGFFTAGRQPPVIGIDANLSMISSHLFVSNFFPIWHETTVNTTMLDGTEITVTLYPEVLDLIQQFPSYSVLRQILANPQSYGHGVMPTSSLRYMYMLGLYFPAVTGIMAGSNRSGDLKDASKSLPRGTLAAVLVTGSTYLAHAVLWGTVAERSTLVNPEAVSTIAASISFPLPQIVQAGIILSSVGAGLQSLAGAPRLLGAICKDNIIPGFHKIAPREGKEPRLHVVITWFICNACILAGTLDAITHLITMFYLLCHGFINLACFILCILRSPSFRPTWKYYHWSTSLLGFLLCVAIMFMTSPLFALIAILIAVVTFIVIMYKGEDKNWGDATQGLKFQLAQTQLLRLQGRVKEHLKNWRPQVLVLIDVDFVENEGELVPVIVHPSLIAFSNQLKKGRGMSILAAVVEGNSRIKSDVERRKRLVECMTKVVETGTAEGEKVGHGRLRAFPLVAFAEKRALGHESLVQTAGLGELVPNSVLTYYPTQWRAKSASAIDFLWLQHTAASMNNAFIAVKGDMPFDNDCFSARKVSQVSSSTGTVDVWYNVHDGGLLLLLPFLLQKHRVWSETVLRIFTVADNEEEKAELESDLHLVMKSLRIRALVEVLCATPRATNALALSSGNRASLSKSRRTSHGRDSSEASLPKISESLNETEDVVKDPVTVVSGAKPMSKASSHADTDPFVKHADHIENAKSLNDLIKQRSVDAAVVFLTMPLAAKESIGSTSAAMEYMEYLDVLIDGLPRVVLGIGTGVELVTGFG